MKRKKAVKRKASSRSVRAAVILIVLLAAAVFHQLVFTLSGARWAARRVMAIVPGLSLEVAGGRLWDGVNIRRLRWRRDYLEVRIDCLLVRWSPPAALRGRFELAGIHAAHVDIAVTREHPPAVDRPLLASLDPERREGVSLPEIYIPFTVNLAEATVDRFSLRRGERVEIFRRLRLQAELRASDLDIRRLSAVHERATASLAGYLSLKDDYPLNFRCWARAAIVDGEPLEAYAELNGTLGELVVDLKTGGLFELTVEGRASPLDSDLPMDLAVSWPRLGWPPDDYRVIDCRNGEVRLQGTLSDYRLTAEFGLDGYIPASHWRLAAVGDWRNTVVESLRGELLRGKIDLEGRVDWQRPLRGVADITVSGLQPADAHHLAPSNLQARARFEGRAGEGKRNLDFELSALSADWRGLSLQSAARIGYRTDSGWQLAEATVTADDAELDITADLNRQLALNCNLRVDDLSVFHPAAEGRLKATAEACGLLRSPDVSFSVEAAGLRWNEHLSVSEAEITGEIRELGTGASSLKARADRVLAPGMPEHWESLSLTIEGVRKDHRALLEAAGPLGILVQLQGALAAGGEWSGKLESASLELADEYLEMEYPAGMEFEPRTRRVDLAAHSWRYGQSRIVFDDIRLGAAGDINARLENFSLDNLSPWLPPHVRAAGALEAELNAAWEEGKRPVGRFSLEVVDGRVSMGDPVEPEDTLLIVPLRRISLDAGLEDAGRGRVGLELDAAEMGRVEFDADIRPCPDDGERMSGNLSVEELQVEAALPFIPRLHGLDGVINAEIRLDGDPRRPQLLGDVRLVGGAVHAIEPEFQFDDIELRLAVDGQSADIEGSFRGGDGSATLAGNAKWAADEWEGSVKISGKQLELTYDPIALLKADPEIELRARPGQIEINGEITIPWADISIRELPEGAVRTSDDAVITRGRDEEPPDNGAFAGVWAMVMDVDVIMGDRVMISGHGLKGRLDGRLEVKQVVGAVPLVVGEIYLRDGVYRAYGQQLEVREGRFVFAGPVGAPDLYVEAVRRLPAYNVTAGMRLEGSPEDPRMTLFSRPVMPEEDVLSYLLLGRPLFGVDDEGISVLGGAAGMLGVAGGSRVLGYVEELGIEEVGVEAVGVGEEAEVLVTGRIGPRLRVGYGVGVFSPVSRFLLRYELHRRMHLEAESGEENAMDIFYTFSF